MAGDLTIVGDLELLLLQLPKLHIFKYKLQDEVERETLSSWQRNTYQDFFLPGRCCMDLIQGTVVQHH